MKRTASLVLALLLTAALFAGCAKSGETETTTVPAADTQPDTAAAETDEQSTQDKLGTADFGGDTYVILSRELTAYEYESSEEDGNIVKAAVTHRNDLIEDRFKVSLEIVKRPGNWAERESFISDVEVAFKSGHLYDLVSTHSAYTASLGIKGFLYNMMNLEDVDFGEKWWCPAYTKNVVYNGAAYTAVGDIGYTLYEFLMCVFYNKTIASQYQVEDLYALVRSQDWTIDKMMEIVVKVSEDVNGNDVPDTGDVFGLAMSNHSARLAMTAWGAEMTEPGDNGRQKVHLNYDKFYEAYAKLYDATWSHPKNVCWLVEGSQHVPEFVNDHILFFPERMTDASRMRDMTSEYGILPFPKYDKDQENYISSARDAMNAIGIMRTIENPDMVGKITEALCMYGLSEITPAYYETTLKYRYLNDPDAVYVLDLIRDTLTFEFAMTYTYSLNTLYSLAGDGIKAQQKDIASSIRSAEKATPKLLNNIYESYDKIKN